MTTRPSDPVTAYARAVVGGKEIAGRQVRLACQRHLKDLEHGPARGLVWRVEDARDGIEFFERFLHLPDIDRDDDTGEEELSLEALAEPIAGIPFLLTPWQKFVVGSVCGWWTVKKTVRFRIAYAEIGKGNGKTPLMSGLGIRAMFLGRRGAQCYFAATSRDQARLAYVDAQNMVRASPLIHKRVDVGEHNMAVLSSGSFLRPISAEKRGLDGKRVQFAGIDEVHEARAIVVQKMRAGTKGRKNAQIVIITNSGFDKTSICWQLHEYSRKVLEGVIENDAWFAFVCQLDPCDEHAKAGRQFPDEKCLKCDRWDVEGPHWRKANPNLGVSITWDYLRELVREAKGMPASAAIVQRLNFCVWTEQRVVFLDMGAWLECATFTEDELGGATCYAGLDLGQSDDLSAFVRIWTLADGRIAVKARFWVPESALQQYPERPYAQWKAAGVLEITQGTTTDEDQVEEAVQADCLADGVRTLAYDKRFANHMALHLQGAGITCVDTPQGFQLTEAMRRLEKLTKDRAIAHNGNPILAWMASNLVARFGRNKEVRPDKDASAEKIDGVVALIMALDAALDELPESASVYDSPEREDGIALIDFS